MKALRRCAGIAVAAAALLVSSRVHAEAVITTFDSFVSDALYPSWTLPNTVSGPTSYSVTATGYGSNYKYIGFPAIAGAGNTHLQLTVNLSGPLEADGHLGPIVGLIDGDGTHHNYAWYGQTLGSHVLTVSVAAPTWVAAPGTTAGFDLSTLTHMHMQLDPGGFGTAGAYTVEWQDLRLITIPEPGAVGMVAGGAVALAAMRRRR